MKLTKKVQFFFIAYFNMNIRSFLFYVTSKSPSTCFSKFSSHLLCYYSWISSCYSHINFVEIVFIYQQIWIKAFNDAAIHETGLNFFGKKRTYQTVQILFNVTRTTMPQVKYFVIEMKSKSRSQKINPEFDLWFKSMIDLFGAN